MRYDDPISTTNRLGLACSLAAVLVFAAACGARDATASAPALDPPPPVTPPSPPAPPPAPPTVAPAAIAGDLHHGIDVSVHSGSIDWTTLVADGHTFAFVKATEGMDLKDPAFDRHWRAMKEAGLVRGAYHFYVTEDDPEAQARFFIDTVTLEPGDLAPVVDVELIGHGTEPGLPERLRTFLELVAAHYGVTPIIYTSADFWDRHLGDGFGEHPLWVAEYQVDQPRLPVGWDHWHLWQWQGDASVPGVEKGADLSRVNRSGVDLTALVVD